MLMRTMNGTLLPWSDDAIKEIAKHPEGAVIDVTLKVEPEISDQQRKAIYVYCNLLAKAFNKAGIMRRLILPGGMEIETSWSKESVKDDIWRELQKALCGSESVNDLEPREVNEIYKHINRDVAAPQGVHVPFPRWEDLAT